MKTPNSMWLHPMTVRKSLWGMLAVWMTVVSTGFVGAQSTASRVGMIGDFKAKSLVGSWVETVKFLDGPMKGRMSKSLVIFHDDGTVISSDQGSVTTDPPPTSVNSDGVGAWMQKDWRTFMYTEKGIFSDASGNLTGFLKVSGTYTLRPSGDAYTGTSFYEVLGPDQKSLPPPNGPVTGTVSNSGERIHVEPTPSP
jgi:hypothetical protein